MIKNRTIFTRDSFEVLRGMADSPRKLNEVGKRVYSLSCSGAESPARVSSSFAMRSALAPRNAP